MKRLVPLGVIVVTLAVTRALVSAIDPAVPSQSWMMSDNLATVRAGASATLLSDGDVLVAGGVDTDGVTTSVDRYNPGAWDFSATAPMQTARANHTATPLTDGRVLVVGGTGADGRAIASAELYDPGSNGWLPAGSLNVARRGHTATLLQDGTVLIAGGDDAGAPTATLERFDPATAIFTPVGTLTAIRTQHGAALLADGRVLVAGGFDGTDALASTDIFDPESGIISEGPALGMARFGLSLTTLLDGHVLVAGGANTSGTLATAEVFDPASNSLLATGTPLAFARQNHLALLLPHNNQVLIVGGTDDGGPVVAAEYFTPWEGPTGAFCASGGVNGSGVCASGYSAPNPPGSTRVWATGAALSFPADMVRRSGPNDGALLVAGGSGSQSAELYGFATIKTDKEDYTPGTTVVITGSGWEPGESVALVLREEPLLDEHPLLSVTADEQGDIVSTEFVPDEHDLGIRFYLYAYGTRSQAQTTFRDNKNLAITFAGNGTGTVTAALTSPAGPTSSLSASGIFTIDNNQVGTLTATAGAGSVFAGWTGTFVGGGTTTCTGTTSPCSFSMSNAAQALTATFVKNDFIGTVTVGPQVGTVSYGTGGSVSYLVTVNRGTSTGAFTASLSIGTLPSGVTASFSATSLPFTSGESVKTATLTLTTTSTSLAQTATPFSVTARNALLSSDNGTGSGALTIARRPLTVTAAPDTKTYDGGTTATATPTITLGTVANSQTTTFTESYQDRHVGSGKTLIPTGTVNDGNGGANYLITFVNSTNGTITRRTVEPFINAHDKTYDGGTSATLGAQGVTGAIAPDVVTLEVAAADFDTEHVGANKPVTASGLTLGGADAGNYTLNGVVTTVDLAAITPRSVSGSFTANSRPYDGTTVATIITRSVGAGVIGGDDVTLAGGTATFADENVGLGKLVTGIGFALAGADGGNYQLVPTTLTTTADITPLSLTVTGITANHKIYDGTTTATLSTAAAQLLGAIDDDNVTLDVSAAAGTFANAHVGVSKPVSVFGLALAGGDADNYSLTPPTATADITPKALTVSGIVAASRIYDGTTDAIVNSTGATLNGVVSDDSVTVDTTGVSGSFADKTVGTDKIVTIVGIALIGEDASNYTVSSTATTAADITPRTLTVSASGVSRQYDGTTNATVTLSDDRVSGDDLTLVSSASFSNKHVGTDKPVDVSAITIAAGADAGNYILGDTTAATSANITAKPLAITATGQNKVYDGTTSATVVLGDDRVAGDDVTLSYTAAFGDKNVGSGKPVSVTDIAVSGGADQGNYSLGSTATTTTASITPRALTVTASGVDKVYDGTTTATVVLADDRLSGDAVTVTYASAHFADANVGTGKSVAVSGIGLSGLDSGNYTPNAAATTTASIAVRPLTVVADHKSKTYGDADPVLTYQITSGTLAAGDVFSGALTRAVGESVGGHAITQGTLSLDDNYALIFVGAELTVSARPVIVTADAKTKTYGDADPALTYQITSGSLVFSDAFAGALTRVIGQHVGSYAIQQGTLALSSNYALTFVGASLTIAARPITITADTQTKVMGAPDPALTYQVTSGSIVSGDAFSGALTRVAGEAVGTYEIQHGSLTAGANYTLSFVGAHLTIVYSTASCLGQAGHTILQPINADGTSVVKKNATVPAKFRVCDANGTSIGAPGVVTGFRIVQVINGTATNVNEAPESTTPDAAFRWDPTDRLWIYNLSTKDSFIVVGRTYVFNITLADGSIIPFRFGVK